MDSDGNPNYSPDVQRHYYGLLTGLHPFLSLVIGSHYGTTLTSWEPLSNLPEFFLDDIPVWAWFRFVSLRRARYHLIRPFSTPVDSPRNSCGISCSRIRVLGIEIRADNGGFREPDPSLNHSCVTRCSVQYPPLLFLEKISCLAMIMGEYPDSGQGSGFDPRAS